MKAEEYNESQAGRLWSLNDLPGDLARVAGLHGVNSVQFVTAVREVQAVRGMKPDGKLGPRTWAVLRAERPAAVGDALIRVAGVAFLRPTRTEARPEHPINGDGGAARVASLWNHYGGAIAGLAGEHDIPVGVALAVFLTEVGSLAYDPDTGLLIIRFEKHLFEPGVHMRHDDRQATEWAAFTAAAAVDLNKAFLSTSFGLPQMMGFNYDKAGYISPVEMALDFQNDVISQIKGFFAFCRAEGLVAFIRRRDWRRFTRRYNGTGQVEYYSGVLSSNVDMVAALGFDV